MGQDRRIILWIILMVIIGSASVCTAKWIGQHTGEKPEDLIVEYMGHIKEKDYAAMYAMTDPESSSDIGRERYIERHSKIYEGMEVGDVTLRGIVAGEPEGGRVTVSYTTSFDTAAGAVTFKNQAVFVETEEGYRLSWQDSLIHPDLSAADRVQVSTLQAERGRILDRNGNALAGAGTASSVGIVPGRLADEADAYRQLAALLEMDEETIRERSKASWVKEDSFVPLATIPKIQELDLLSPRADEALQKEYARQEQLLAVPGVMLTDVEVRSYGSGAAAAHLIGYVQEVTAEDLEEHAGGGYSSGSVIGRTGMEGLFEEELKGKDGCEISILDKEGNTKTVLANVPKEDGQDIRLTIDCDLQQSLYEQFKEVRGCSVAMDPYTGEVLALVSTPSYDDNDLIKGISAEKWAALENDADRPLYNRFRQVWCPGSTLKPVVAAIGLKTGMLDPDEDFGNEGLAWQKDTSWGAYQVTTLQAYEPVVLRNALLYSDNIYFAKAALRIGADRMARELEAVGFDRELPFEIAMAASQYSNGDTIETEIQLADSGYGQGQILVNPLHLTCMYTAFLNGGNMIKPCLRYREGAAGEIWIREAFTAEVVSEVLEGMKSVVNDPGGTGYAAHRDDLILAGKTGTAELKATREDTTGTEIGWFAVFTAERSVDRPILLISMVEDVKDIGGSGYVVGKDKAVLDQYLASQ